MPERKRHTWIPPTAAAPLAGLAVVGAGAVAATSVDLTGAAVPPAAIAAAVVLVVGGLAALGARRAERRQAEPLEELAEAAGRREAALRHAVVAIQRPGTEVPEVEPLAGDLDGPAGQLAAALDAVHDVATRAAHEQAALRASVKKTVLHLARRNQSLLDRQLRYLDDLEDSETDPDQLEHLFALDHLATRMRRNAESLLVLAGADPARRRRQPVPVADVLRAAASEVEDYARVDITGSMDVALDGTAAASTAHLLAELIENATGFSPPFSRVSVTAEPATDGMLVTIVDKGLGMATPDLLAANDVLARPPAEDVVLGPQLGFAVVARVADRFGIRVHLSLTSDAGGVTARVTLPARILRSLAAPAPVAPAAPVAPQAHPAPSAPAEPQPLFSRPASAEPEVAAAEPTPAPLFSRPAPAEPEVA
ncbi:MAG TPA: ATP-binding protein, partial [Acidimicrobiales bacterium]|nr:ATP-binding protein [Acidimicrobiales bacterium]